MRCYRQLLLLLGSSLLLHGADRINHEGRILGPPPHVTNAVLFNTPEADTIVAALQIFPVTHPWNENISRRPLLANSEAMIAQIVSDLSSSRRVLRLFFEMNFVLVPGDQPLVPVEFVEYPDESDPGPYPLPANLPIETWPRETGSLTLRQWQLDANDDGGDRHAIVVQPETGLLWEMWQAKLFETPEAGSRWQAANGAKFGLQSNSLRPAGWTSADAAGLAMFPALVRYDECERGMVEHALRLVVRRTRVGPIYPATHQASVGNLTDPNIPAMGQRLRLKAGFSIPAQWNKHERAVALGLKKYGALVADNGGFFSISVTPDHRWPEDAFAHLHNLGIDNFEVIQTTGPAEGPRSPGAPSVDAGPDRTAGIGVPIDLQGKVTYAGNKPFVQWMLYSGTGPAAFDDASQANAKVTFKAPGPHTLRLSADDGVHAVAYDAVIVNATVNISVRMERSGADGAIISWTGGSPPFVIESSSDLSPTSWVRRATNWTGQVPWRFDAKSEFLRVQ
jgi:hypothetical protein